MGLFGGSKTYVSSTLYNMAGAEEDRAQFLKTLIVGKVITNSKRSFTEVLQSGYINGPGIKFRNFYRWADDNYDLIGVPQGSLASAVDLPASVVASHIPHASSETVQIQRIQMDNADFSYWADQWMFENEPDQLDSDWVSDFDDVTGKVVITFEDNSSVSFTPTNFVYDAIYIYATYNTYTDIDEDWSPTTVFIYRLGSGITEIDELVVAEGNDGGYFPFVPVRLDNKFLSETFEPDAYELASKAYRKATGGNFDSLVENLEDNEDLDDIDFAYVMFGVSLNVRENSCRKYLYRFFKKLMINQSTDFDDYDFWKDGQVEQTEQNATWVEWRNAQENPLDPLYGSPEPDRGSPAALPSSEIRIKSSGTLDTNVDIRISWQSIDEVSGSGLKKPDAKKGEYWLEYIGQDSFPTMIHNQGEEYTTRNINVDQFAIHWQVDEDNWKSIVVTGMVHRNYIYKGKFVEITAKEALEDPDESGFLVPLHYDTYREMSLVDSTQMATACCFLVLNSYEVVKQKWYQTGIFKIVLFVAIIAVAVTTGGIGAAGVGLLGTNAAVGAAVGLTGTLAVIVGAAANAIAAMILTKIITMGATALLGDKLGALIGTIASIAAIQIGTALSNGGSMATFFEGMTKADNIIALSSAVGDGYAGYIRAGAMETLVKTQKVMEDYEKESKEISDLYAENIGYGRGIIDPTSLTDVSNIYMESRDSFLERTLMTGSDVAELSINLVTNYTELSLSTDLKV